MPPPSRTAVTAEQAIRSRPEITGIRYAWLTCLIGYCAAQHDRLTRNRGRFAATPGRSSMRHPLRRISSGMSELLRRVDRVAGDLNVLLVVIAIGLATLDFTFLVTQKAIATLPPITHVSHDATDGAR